MYMYVRHSCIKYCLVKEQYNSRPTLQSLCVCMCTYQSSSALLTLTTLGKVCTRWRTKTLIICDQLHSQWLLWRSSFDGGHTLALLVSSWMVLCSWLPVKTTLSSATNQWKWSWLCKWSIGVAATLIIFVLCLALTLSWLFRHSSSVWACVVYPPCVCSLLPILQLFQTCVVAWMKQTDKGIYRKHEIKVRPISNNFTSPFCLMQGPKSFSLNHTLLQCFRRRCFDSPFEAAWADHVFMFSQCFYGN